MSHYHEVYAFQGSNWGLVQALDADLTEVRRIGDDVLRRDGVLGVRILAEQANPTGEARMRVVVRRDKRPDLPTFALGPDGRPLYGGRPGVGPGAAGATGAHPRRRGAVPARARPTPVRGPAARPGSLGALATPGEWILGGTLVALALTGLAVLALLPAVPEDWVFAHQFGWLAALVALILVLGLFLWRVVANGLLLVDRRAATEVVPEPVRTPAPASAAPPVGGARSYGPSVAAPADPDRPDPNEEQLVNRAMSLVDEGFRRAQDRMDSFGWLGFRLFLAGLARGMAPAGPERRQQRYLRRLLERIGDTPHRVNDFVGRWGTTLRNPRNAEMAGAGQRAWEAMDPTAFARAIEWWSDPAAPEPMASAVTCILSVQTPLSLRRKAIDRFDALVQEFAGVRHGDDQIATAAFPGAVGAFEVALQLARDLPEAKLQIGLGIANDQETAAAEARAIAGSARGGEILAGNLIRDYAQGRAKFSQAEGRPGWLVQP